VPCKIALAKSEDGTATRSTIDFRQERERGVGRPRVSSNYRSSRGDYNAGRFIVTINSAPWLYDKQEARRRRDNGCRCSNQLRDRVAYRESRLPGARRRQLTRDRAYSANRSRRGKTRLAISRYRDSSTFKRLRYAAPFKLGARRLVDAFSSGTTSKCDRARVYLSARGVLRALTLLASRTRDARRAPLFAAIRYARCRASSLPRARPLVPASERKSGPPNRNRISPARERTSRLRKKTGRESEENPLLGEPS